MISDEQKYFDEKKVRDLALTELFRWGLTSGRLDQNALDEIAVNMAQRYVGLARESGIDAGVSGEQPVLDNAVNISTNVFATLGVSELAAAEVSGDTMRLIIDEHSCYLSRDALGDFEGSFPMVCLYPKFLETVLLDLLPDGQKVELLAEGAAYISKSEGCCCVIFRAIK
jgi:hypothetical protein